MVHIAKDCQALGFDEQRLPRVSEDQSRKKRRPASGVDVDYISGLPWIVTEDFVIRSRAPLFADVSKILFCQYTSGSTMEPKVDGDHENILHTFPLDDRP